MHDNEQKCLSMEKKTKSKDKLLEKQNICVKLESEQISETTSIDVFESGKKKKKHNKSRHSKDILPNCKDLTTETNCDSSKADDKVKLKKKKKRAKEKFEPTESSATNCDANIEGEMKLKKDKKCKEEKNLCTVLSETNCDVSLLEKKMKLKKNKKSKQEKNVSTVLSETKCDVSMVEEKIKQKKNKKCKQEKNVSTEFSETNGDVSVVEEKIKLKKSTKEKNISTVFSETNCDVSMVEEKIKQKKHKQEQLNISSETIQGNKTQTDQKKTKKRKKSETESDVLNITDKGDTNSMDITESVCQQIPSETKYEKKSKKLKLEIHADNVASQDVKYNMSEQNLTSICENDNSKHHKKKKKHSKSRDSTTLNETKCKKHKKKCKVNTDFTIDINNSGIFQENIVTSASDLVNSPKLKRATCSNAETPDSINHITSDRTNSKHKKKKKHSKSRDSTLDVTKCKKHKKKCQDKTDFTIDINNSGISQENIVTSTSDLVNSPKLKSTTSSKAETPDSINHITSDHTNSNHKKKKKHSKNKESSSVEIKKAQDIPVYIISNGSMHDSCSHTHANEPVLNQSRLNKMTANSVCTASVEGQWHGNLFDSSERQNKFLRLLGGMKKSAESSENKKEISQTCAKKKGLFGSLASLVNRDNHRGGSEALSATAAANLNQKLEEEYNKALNFKLSGKIGTGFGFVQDPAEGKKFHIDVNKSKSVKFDE